MKDLVQQRQEAALAGAFTMAVIAAVVALLMATPMPDPLQVKIATDPDSVEVSSYPAP